MLHTSVKGGTGAGRKGHIKPVNKADWLCSKRSGGCGKTIKYYWTRCPNCGAKRPD